MQPPPEDRSRPGEVVWGPIGIEDAAAAGSRMPSASVVLRGIVLTYLLKLLVGSSYSHVRLSGRSPWLLLRT